MKFVVNDSCIGCGSCEYHCPSVFTVVNDEKAEAVDKVIIDEKTIKEAMEAVDNCPTSAIEVIE
jgi:ferredoxin